MPLSLVQSRFTRNPARMMKVEVVFAKAVEQKIVELELVENSTVEDAVRASGLCAMYPEIIVGETPVGIYAERVRYETILSEGDRDRPLEVDPMEARRLRARAQASKR